jgi:simple sugar transport system permease protein
MQIETSVPIEVIDIIQALVILFLAADLIVRRVFRVRGTKGEISELKTVTQSWAGGVGGASPT